ncbi:MAG: hypothetical protein ABR985_12525 [Methanotrichaceae archaeon]
MKSSFRPLNPLVSGSEIFYMKCHELRSLFRELIPSAEEPDNPRGLDMIKLPWKGRGNDL